MSLTTSQLSTLKTAIGADPVLAAQPQNSDGAFAIAEAMNLTASPDFYVWRSSTPISEIMRNGFDWTFVDNLTVGKARIWEWMQLTGILNMSEPNVRAGVIAVFTAAGMSAMRLQIFGHGQRLASRVEKLLATGTGTTTNDHGVGPATMGFEGPVSYQDVEQARNG